MSLPAHPSAPRDFDFILGDWTVRHRRLDVRLAGCTTWTEFDGRSSTSRILGGFGVVEDNVLAFPDGEVRAAAFRSFDPAAGLWSIWWLDARRPQSLDMPVRGRFEAGVGTFLAEDLHEGRPVRVRFTWTKAARDTGQPRWEQAFSPDGGATWETNWTMDFRPAVSA